MQPGDKAGGEGGWVDLSLVKKHLQPDFDVRATGFKKMKAWVQSAPRHFECKQAKKEKGQKAGFTAVRLVGGGLELLGRAEAAQIESNQSEDVARIVESDEVGSSEKDGPALLARAEEEHSVEDGQVLPWRKAGLLKSSR